MNPVVIGWGIWEVAAQRCDPRSAPVACAATVSTREVTESWTLREA